jgi:hypothetical protein
MHATVAGADPRDGEDDDSGAEVKKEAAAVWGLDVLLSSVEACFLVSVP